MPLQNYCSQLFINTYIALDIRTSPLCFVVIILASSELMGLFQPYIFQVCFDKLDDLCKRQLTFDRSL